MGRRIQGPLSWAEPQRLRSQIEHVGSVGLTFQAESLSERWQDPGDGKGVSTVWRQTGPVRPGRVVCRHSRPAQKWREAWSQTSQGASALRPPPPCHGKSSRTRQWGGGRGVWHAAGVRSRTPWWNGDCTRSPVAFRKTQAYVSSSLEFGICGFCPLQWEPPGTPWTLGSTPRRGRGPFPWENWAEEMRGTLRGPEPL